METIADEVRLMIRSARSAEKLNGLVQTVDSLKPTLQGLAEHDPQFAPEISAIAQHLAEAVDAAGRAIQYLDARLSAR